MGVSLDSGPTSATFELMLVNDGTAPTDLISIEPSLQAPVDVFDFDIPTPVPAFLAPGEYLTATSTPASPEFTMVH
jgi:hypothetical protein